MNGKPCIICGKELKPVMETWEWMQPYGGGEVKLTFCYGSAKFDWYPSCTQFRGVICDDCTVEIQDRLEKI